LKAQANTRTKCPVCENPEAELFAEVKPNGKIGCLCWNCSKGYITKNPNDGWDEYKFLDIDYFFNKYYKSSSTNSIIRELCRIEFECEVTK